MLLVDLFFPLPGAVVPRFRQTRGIVNPYFLLLVPWSAFVGVPRCLELLLTRQSAEHGAVEPQNGMSFPHSVDTPWSVHRPNLSRNQWRKEQMANECVTMELRD